MQGHLASCFTPLVNNASLVFIRWCFPLDSTQTRVNVFICPGYVSALALHSLILCTADCTVKWGDFSDYKKRLLRVKHSMKSPHDILRCCMTMRAHQNNPLFPCFNGTPTIWVTTSRTESNGPAVSLGFSLIGLHVHHRRVFLPGVPHFDCAC